jgi:hypothetical protein
MATAKEMLSAVLQRAELNPRERESFEDMWDRINRYDRCSEKQKAWIEKVYFAQKLDRTAIAIPVRRRIVTPTWLKNAKPDESTQVQPTVRVNPEPVAAPSLVKTTSRQVLQRRPSSKSGTFLATPTPPSNQKVAFINYPVPRETLVTSAGQFAEVCPRVDRSSRQYQRIVEFFDRGGVVLKIKPVAESQVA